MTQPRLGHVAALDGLRGVAILLVLGQHLFHFPIAGSLGVDLFFVLSGFLITTLLLEEKAVRGQVSLRRFYMRRARRLLPALTVLLLTFLVLGGTLHTVELGGLYVGNLVQAFSNPNPLVRGGLGHLWSLAEEEQFYLLWPLVLLALTRSRKAPHLLAALLVSLVGYRTGLILSGVHGPRIYYAPDTHSTGLLLGALLAVVRTRRPIRVPEPLVIFSLAVLIQGAVIDEVVAPYSTQYALPVFEAACVVLVAAAVSGSPFAEAISNAPLVWVGKISYSLYLWGGMLYWAFGFHRPILVLVVSLGAAWLSYRVIERPFRRASRNAIEPARPTSTATTGG